MKENLDNKEYEIIADYLGESEEEIIPKRPPLLDVILEYVYTTYPDIKEKYIPNHHVDIYDILEDISLENPERACEIYKAIILSFQENLISSKEDAYWLTEPFIEILAEIDNLYFISYLDGEENLAEILLSQNFNLADSFVGLLIKLIHKNDLIRLKRYINLINRNRYFEENGECIHFDEMVDELKEVCNVNTSKEITEYLKLLR